MYLLRFLGGCLLGLAAGSLILTCLRYYPEYVVHFGLEVIGQGVLWLAYTHVCKANWHRVAIWFAGTLLTTIVTVHLIG